MGGSPYSLPEAWAKCSTRQPKIQVYLLIRGSIAILHLQVISALPPDEKGEGTLAEKQIVIIGAGPGGYVAALRAAQLGAQVTLIERDRIGGICLNEGCIPTKALLHIAETLEAIQQASKFGIHLSTPPTLDWSKALAHKSSVVQRLTKGVATLLSRAGVQIITGSARFASSNTLLVDTPDGTETLQAEQIIIATGSRPAIPPIPGIDLPGVIDSTAALYLEQLPERMLILGGGVIGCEFATLFHACGVDVSIVEMMPCLVPTIDPELSQTLQRNLKRKGIHLYLESKLVRIDRGDNGLRATLHTPKGEKSLETDLLLVSVGRQPNLEDLDLEKAGVHFTKAGIPVDQHMRTNQPNIYAIGDVAQTGPLLAHVAMREGEIAAEHAVGMESTMDYRAVPTCIFTIPEIASVGLTEEQALQAGYALATGKAFFLANGKALATGEREGFAKVIADRESGTLLGVHIIGPHASDLILEAGLALTIGGKLHDIERTIHPHPTLGEAIAEATKIALGRPLHA